MYKKIVITGTTGQVGSHLCGLLKDRATIIPYLDPRGNLLDLGDFDVLTSFLRQHRPDLIINAAAYTAVDKAESEQETAFRINGLATGVLGEEARKLGIPVIHYSTDYVFRGDGTAPWKEISPIGPLSAYGMSKLAGEVALAGSGCAFVTLRTSWVFSNYGHNFVKTMLRLGAERETLSVVADQYGAPTSAAFLARHTAAIVEHGNKSGSLRDVSGIYHLACAGETTWHGFASKVFELARAEGLLLKVREVKAIPTEAYPTPARRPANSRLDCGKFMRTFSCGLESWTDELIPVVRDLVRNPAN